MGQRGVRGEPDFETDRIFGETGERKIASDLSDMAIEGSWEIKTKSAKYIDSFFYLEGWQHPYSLDCSEGRDCQNVEHWIKSGLLLSQAEHLGFNIGDSGVWVHFPMKAMAALIGNKRNNNAEYKTVRLGDNPTKGYLVGFNEILRWCADYQPKEESNQISLDLVSNARGFGENYQLES